MSTPLPQTEGQTPQRPDRGAQARAWLNAVGPMLGLLVIFALFAVIAPPTFRSPNNMETIARQTAIVGAAALGMTLIMILGGIDLSVGSIVALSTVGIAWAMQEAHWSPAIAALVGILAGGLCGALSGLIITRLKVVPFIVTMGMMLVVRGLAKAIAHEQKIDAPESWLETLLASLTPERAYLLVPIGVWLVVVLAIGVAALLRYTRLGRHIFAIGSNELTARLCGISVDGTKLTTYTIGGLFFGLAGVMLFSRLTVGDPTAAIGLELDVIAAVVIGGGSLNGGEGSVFGSLVGALIMSVIRSGCSQMGLDNWVQEVVTGAVIVAAVALDRLRHRRTS